MWTDQSVGHRSPRISKSAAPGANVTPSTPPTTRTTNDESGCRSSVSSRTLSENESGFALTMPMTRGSATGRRLPDRVKSTIFNALIETIDLTQLAQLDPESARDEIRDIVAEIISIKNVVMSIAEQEDLLEDICNDVLGYGPLEPLLARDDIADIMVNGSKQVFIEVNGKVEQTGIRFRDNQQLLNICQRIVSQVGRRVDESSPICDARLPDGSRVNVIAPPLSIDGAALTIRKFKKDKLTLEQLVKYGSISPEGAEILKIVGRVRYRGRFDASCAIIQQAAMEITHGFRATVFDMDSKSRTFELIIAI